MYQNLAKTVAFLYQSCTSQCPTFIGDFSWWADLPHDLEIMSNDFLLIQKQNREVNYPTYKKERKRKFLRVFVEEDFK